MPVSPARLASFRILQKTEEDEAYVSELMHTEPLSSFSERDHSLTCELVFGILRHQRLLDWYLSHFSKSPLERLDSEVRLALRLGAYQILFLTRVPVSAAINESVELVKAARLRSAAGFTNAVLRRINKKEFEKALKALSHDSVEDLSIRYSHPEWLVQRWMNAFGRERTLQLLLRSNRPPPVFFRVNTPGLSEAQLFEELKPEGVRFRAVPFGKDILELREGNIYRTTLFSHHKIVVQDAGSQLIPHLLDPKPKSLCLDLCSAPGGKASQIAQLTGGEARIMATDIHWHRLRIARRLHGGPWQNLWFVAADGTQPLPCVVRFDRVLVDAPCSGTGTLQRHPEIRWRLKPGDLQRLPQLQIALLENASQYVKPNGLLVYSTCSMEKEENQDVVKEFLKNHPELYLELPSNPDLHQFFDKERFFRLLPSDFNADGFFAALLGKTAEYQ